MYWKNLDFGIITDEARKQGIEIRKILISNDCNAGAVGVYKILEITKDNIVYITIGTGIGGGAIINRKLLVGANYSAMELGHTKIGEKSYRCGCGAFSCIETFASAKSLVNYYNNKYRKNYQKLLPIIQNEDFSKVNRLFKRFCKYLSILLNNIIYTIDPDFIFISGKIALSSEFFEEYLKNEIFSKITMIKEYDVSRIIFLKNVKQYNSYNLVGSTFVDEFL